MIFTSFLAYVFLLILSSVSAFYMGYYYRIYLEETERKKKKNIFK